MPWRASAVSVCGGWTPRCKRGRINKESHKGQMGCGNEDSHSVLFFGSICLNSRLQSPDKDRACHFPSSRGSTFSARATMSNNLESPFCMATDGNSIFGTGFAYNLSLNLTSSVASAYPDWLVLTQSTSTQLSPVLESSPFYNASLFTQLSSLNWTIIFSIPRVAVNLFPNITYAFSCGVASDGYFALRAQPYPDLQVQLAPSLLIRLPTTNSTRESVVDNSASGGFRDYEVFGNDDIESNNTRIFALRNEISDYSSPLLSLGRWAGSESHKSSNWYSQPGSATALVAANDIITANCTGSSCPGGGSTDPGEWVQIWSTCATDMNNLDQIDIQYAVSSNGVFPTKPQATWELQVRYTPNPFLFNPFIHPLTYSFTHSNAYGRHCIIF